MAGPDEGPKINAGLGFNVPPAARLLGMLRGLSGLERGRRGCRVQIFPIGQVVPGCRTWFNKA